MTKIDLNTAPYFDDYNENKKFYKILFRAKRNVQIREFNQLQSIIQNQIQRFGSHVFENGSQVHPGGPDAVRYDNEVYFVKIAKTFQANTQEELETYYLNQTFTSSNGVKGTIIGVKSPDTLDEARLFVKYTKSGGNAGQYPTLTALENFTTDETNVTATVSSNGIGKCTAVTCEESIYFFNGYFILVDKQVLFIEPENPEVPSNWNVTPTCKVGLSIEEEVITYEDDNSLLENVTGSPAEFAPGADRLRINATLVQKQISDNETKDFIELMRINSGVVQLKVLKTEYSVLEDTLARRTYDESGDYTVRPFIVNAKNFLKEGDNNGVHLESEFEFDTQQEAENVAVSVFNTTGASLSPTNTSKWLPCSSYANFLKACREKLSLVVETGKAYVKGYEIEKLAPTIVDVDRARALRYQTNKSINCNLGAYIFVTDIYGVPNVETFETVNIYADRGASPPSGVEPANKIGTAKCLAIEYFSGTHGQTDAIYKLYLHDIQADAGKDIRQMKSVYSTSPTFVANIKLEEFKMTGSVTASGTTLTGNGTSWFTDSTQKLNVGDYIRVGSEFRKITAIASDTSLTLSASLTVTNQSFYLVYGLINGLENETGLLYRLPHENIHTIRGNGQDNIITNSYLSSYSVRRVISQSATAGTLNLPTLGTGELYADFSPLDYSVIQTTGAGAGNWLDLTASNVTPAGSNCTITGAVGTESYLIIATVRKESGSVTKERSKTLNKNTQLITSSGLSNLTNISLGKADVLKVNAIYMSSDFATLPTTSDTNILGRYTLDNGQRDYVYDIASIKLKAGSQRPTGRLLISFDYFSHGNDGNYFSVDSYPFKGVGANMTYEEIPVYNSVTSGGTFDLRNTIDFRARVDDSNPSAYAFVPEMPRGTFTANYHHYLNRVDKLYLDKTGEFRINYGKADIDPQLPPEVTTGLTLYELYMKAYTATPDDCVRKFVENKRYTMNDIGKIAKRVSNLEYYTTLSLLEKETKDLEILDANGNSRFKNGFLVDNFSGHSVGDVQNEDYNCSIDIENGELRPVFYSDNVSLIEKNSLEPNSVIREQLREASHYQKTGEVYTLPYTEQTFMSQTISTKVCNINPFGVFTFVGRVKLTPWSDEWYDTETAPRLLVEDNNSFDSISAGLNAQGTIWSDWTTNWTGKEITTKEAKGQIVARGNNKPDRVHKSNWPRYRQIVTRVTETETGEKSRSGFKQEARITGTIETSLGKKIINQYSAPFIRSREVAFSGKAFLPNTRVYAFFDDVNVTEYCKVTGGSYGDNLVTDTAGNISGVFNIPNTASLKFETGDRIFRLTSDSLNRKDPRPQTHGESNYVAKGIINVEQESVLSTRQFEIVTIPVSESETVSRTSTFDIPKNVVKEDPIAQSFPITEKGGCFLTSVELYFYSKDPVVPVKLQVRPLGAEGSPTNKIVPFGEIIKPAEEVITNVISIENSSLTVVGEGGPWTAESGLEIVSGETYGLSANPDADMIPTKFVFDSPVYLQEGEDYAIVLLADSTAYNVWISQYGPDVTLREGINSTFRTEGEFNTAIGTQTAVLKDPFISGVFFKSVNGRSWVQDQTADLKFKLNKANFDTSSNAVIEFVNEQLKRVRLESDSIETENGSRDIRIYQKNHGHTIDSKVTFEVNYDKELVGTVSSSGTTVTGTGTAFTSNLVVGSVIKDIATGQQRRVTAIGSNTSLTIASAFSPNLSSGSKLLGTSFIVPSNSTLGGVDVEKLLTVDGFVVTFAELDSYIIQLPVSVTANATGRFGGTLFNVSQNKQFHTAHFVMQNLNFSETEVALSVSTTTGADVKNVQTPYLVEDYKNIESNVDINFEVPMQVSSEINEHNSTDTITGPSTVSATEFFTDGSTADQKSLKARVVLKSKNPNLSPIIDSSRLSVITVSNRVDNWKPLELEQRDSEILQVCPTTVTPAVSTTANKLTFTASTGKVTTTDADLAQHLAKLDVGKYVTIANCATTANNISVAKRVVSIEYTPSDTIKCTLVLDHSFATTATDTATNITILQYDRFIDELAPKNGSASSKYVTKRLTLARPSNALRVSFTAFRDVESEIELYYKLLRADDSRNFDDIEYSKANFNLEINGTLTDIIPEPSTSENDFAVYESTINNLNEFIAVAIKIVMKCDNPAKPVRIRDLSIIALDD